MTVACTILVDIAGFTGTFRNPKGGYDRNPAEESQDRALGPKTLLTTLADCLGYLFTTCEHLGSLRPLIHLFTKGIVHCYIFALFT